MDHEAQDNRSTRPETIGESLARKGMAIRMPARFIGPVYQTRLRAYCGPAIIIHVADPAADPPEAEETLP